MSDSKKLIAVNKLTHRQKKFVKYYVQTLNAKRSAMKAGIAEKSSSRWAYKQMHNPMIKLAIKQEMESELLDIDMIKAKAVKTLMEMAFGDIEDFVEWKGNKVTVKDSKKLTYNQRTMIQSVKENVNNAGISTVEIKFYDRQKALDQLGKYLELYTHKLELTGNNGGPVQINNNKIDLSSLTDEELIVMRKVLAKTVEHDKSIGSPLEVEFQENDKDTLED